jgi:Ca2+-dependent lipid-binding protein
MDPNGKSDPFAVFQLSPDVIFKSGTKLKTLEPEWHETFYIPVYEQAKLFIAVFDWDLASSNDFIGNGYL